MENKNIMICLEGLDIGGVETAVFNQAILLTECGHKVIILSKSGIYTELLREKGIICIDFSFELGNNFCQKKTNKIIKLINEYKIDEVHINQFPCILSAVPAYVISNVPYVAYSHVGIEGVYDWYKNTFNLSEDIFTYFFKSAHKVIAITESAKNTIINRFAIEEDKIIVKNNGFNFSMINGMENKRVEKISNMLIISRITNEKETSIKNAIDLFTEYLKKHKESKLTIIGDGELKENIEEYIKNTGADDSVNMVGAKNNVLEYINENDIVIGMGRCILEAIAMKKIAVISGYDTLKSIVTENNIEEAVKQNFSGRNMRAITKEEMLEEFEKMTIEDINKTIEYNYNYAYKYLNLKNDIYVVKDKVNSDVAISSLFELVIKLQEKRVEFEKEKEREKEELLKRMELNKEKELEYKESEILQLRKELAEVYNSKRWKLAEKISKIFH